jgi:hypothetical protein
LVSADAQEYEFDVIDGSRFFLRVPEISALEKNPHVCRTSWALDALLWRSSHGCPAHPTVGVAERRPNPARTPLACNKKITRR